MFDIDSVQFVQLVRQMRDEGKILGGEQLSELLSSLSRCCCKSFCRPLCIPGGSSGKKVRAGAEFVQTQCIYNLNRFKEWMKGVADRGLEKKVYILGGITPLKSVRMAGVHE